MRQVLVDHGRSLDAGDDLHRPAAVLASLDAVRWPIRYKGL
jgi:hypothetical protein